MKILFGKQAFTKKKKKRVPISVKNKETVGKPEERKSFRGTSQPGLEVPGMARFLGKAGFGCLSDRDPNNPGCTQQSLPETLGFKPDSIKDGWQGR